MDCVLEIIQEGNPNCEHYYKVSENINDDISGYACLKCSYTILAYSDSFEQGNRHIIHCKRNKGVNKICSEQQNQTTTPATT